MIVSAQSVQLLSCVWLFVTPWIAAHQAFLSIPSSQSSPKLMSIELVMPSSHLILCGPLLLLPTIPPSISLFQWVNSSHEVAKVLELQHQSFQRMFRVDCLYDWPISFPCCPRDSQESSSTIRKHQFFGTQPSLWSNSHIVLSTFELQRVVQNSVHNEDHASWWKYSRRNM